MLGGGFKAERLRVNLRLVINRLKLLEKKKNERARIRVEHIIREDYLVEAMEILELYCDLLLTRFGLIQSMKELDPGLQEAVSTLIWAAPRIQAEVSELRTVSEQLCAKYSKEYGKLCRTNQIGTVNDRLMHKLGVEAPPKILVERYLIEIAKNYNVPYEPDAMVRPEVSLGEEADLIDEPFNPIGTYNNFQHPMGGGPPPQLPTCPPTYESAVGPGPSSQMFDNNSLPELPSVPDTLPSASFGKNTTSSDDIDFDDLTRRFEELKKKT
ncbi:IST1 like [Dissostichus eleginoides]|uniref:IST1 homolog n=1 Tax=Dissostichus eleginoides TaxID=100907 RepID=A0AAD9F399_DISEL|nr:IST1 like [Dissostichus eleginoides]